jgi:hypothetical protein
MAVGEAYFAEKLLYDMSANVGTGSGRQKVLRVVIRPYFRVFNPEIQ